MMASDGVLESSEFDELDRHFAAFIHEFGGGALVPVGAGFLSRNIRLGHTCLDLSKPPPSDASWRDFAWPALRDWTSAFALNRAVGEPEAVTPLVLTASGLLYLRRYWSYETSLAGAILQRCEAHEPIGAEADLQELAIKTAAARMFVVISGGPGTGKTTTVLRILRRLVGGAGVRKLRIALAAPTGKAAARLQESLRSERATDLEGCALPKDVTTVHRLLGSRRGSVSFRHDSKNPLPVDVLIVDEASMVSLTLMSKLFAALPVNARVILLGDRYQLSSVEPGAVLGEIADAASVSGSPLAGSLITLQKNYRFGDNSHIAKLCELIRSGNADEALAYLEVGTNAELAGGIVPIPSQLPDSLRIPVLAGYSSYLSASSPAEALRAFQSFRVLSALRVGPFGVVNLNRIIEQILRQEGLLTETQAGVPLMVTRNDYQLKLYNGDIGILRPDETGALAAWFTGEDGALRKISPGSAPGTRARLCHDRAQEPGLRV